MIAAMRRAIPMLLLLLMPRQAMAQTRFDLSGGYALAHDWRDQVTLPAGWMAGAAIDLTPAFAAVVEVSGQSKTVALLNADARLTIYTALAGVRGSARLGRLTEFGQIVAGVVRTSGSAFGATTTVHAIGVQPGAGVDFPLTPRWAARAELDIRLIAAQEDAQNGGTQLRFAACLVYRHR
jgi:hypothetical protein